MDLKEDLDKKLKNKKSIDEWLKSYQNAINVLNSSYIDEDSIKIFLLSSNQIVHLIILLIFCIEIQNYLHLTINIIKKFLNIPLANLLMEDQKYPNKGISNW